MELTDHQINILQHPFTSIWFGSCAMGQSTDIVRLTGARIAEDKLHLDLFVPEYYAGTFFKNVQENKKVSFMCSYTHTFEAFQIKGVYVSHRACTQEEVGYQLAYMQGFAQNLLFLGIKAGLSFEKYYRNPSMVIRMKGEEIYEQTPKTGAGNKIS